MRPGGRNRVMSARAPLIFLAALAGAGVVMAQPVSNSVQEAPAPAQLPEEAPPTVVEAANALAAPAVPASEMKPAIPPPQQVADKPAESTQKRARFDVAIVQALDKVTAETIRFAGRRGPAGPLQIHRHHGEGL